MSHLGLPILLVVGPVLVVACNGRPSSVTTPTAVTSGVVVESQRLASALGGCVVRGTVRNDDDTTVTARLLTQILGPHAALRLQLTDRMTAPPGTVLGSSAVGFRAGAERHLTVIGKDDHGERVAVDVVLTLDPR